DSCLVNVYDAEARMGLHQDSDEADLTAPVLSVSLGDTAVFRLGGTTRKAPTRSLRLASGDVCLLAGDARLAFHGVDRILAGSSRLVPGGGRINLTLRRAGAKGGATNDGPDRNRREAGPEDRGRTRAGGPEDREGRADQVRQGDRRVQSPLSR